VPRARSGDLEEKLVRDKIPLIAPGCYKKFEDCEKALRMKLVEEAIEYLLNPSVEELADVVEVVLELVRREGTKVMDVILKKREERGGFKDCWVRVTD